MLQGLQRSLLVDKRCSNRPNSPLKIGLDISGHVACSGLPPLYSQPLGCFA